ncbi:type II secretion system protein GspL [Frateuria sp. GZRR33]|uniref:type II secretion system protein GspL n=1 Tax=Frateuria sp. GZRR33 TaxID=3351535 RepID=UPI003EDCA97E
MTNATQSLRPQLDRARRAWRASPLPRFFAWWFGELGALLPASWGRLFGGGAQWYLLQRTDGRWELRRTGESEVRAQWPRGTEAAIEQAALSAAVRETDREDLRLALLLPVSAVLRRRLLLPRAAADNLQQVGAFEMDRQTPFRVEQVYYAVLELDTPAPAGRFFAELVAVPRDTLDPLLAELEGAGIRVDAVDVAEGAGRLGVNLLPPARVPYRTNPRQRLNLALAAAAVLLLVLALAQWLANREQALATMQAQVQDMQAEAQQVAALRQELQDNAGAASFLVRRKQNRVTMLDLLLDLTRRLPQSAWLERLSVDPSGQVGFQGQAPQAAALIDALKDSKIVRDPNFQGSIQPDPASGKERFYMVAQLRQSGSAAPATPASAGSEAQP